MAPPSSTSSAAMSHEAAPASGQSVQSGQSGQPAPPPAGTGKPARDVAHGWEAVDGSSMWHDVQEDEDGNLLTQHSSLSLAAQIRQRRRRLAATDLARSQKRLVRHMLRHVYLVLDVSAWSREKDPALPPARTRLETTLGLARDFVGAFYDQNPLGHLGVVLCRDGAATLLTSLGGSPRKHTLALGAALVAELGRKGKDAGGEFSLQNGLEVAGRSLGYAPRYGSREILVIASALATCDPGEILTETLPRLRHAGIRVSTVALQAEVHICKKLAEATGGLAGVCLNTGHLRDLTMGHAIPPPVHASEYGGAGAGENSQLTCEFVEMGFPSREGGDVPVLVHSAGGAPPDRRGDGGAAFAVHPTTADDRRSNRLVAFARTGYVCPRCRSRCADLPADCAVCGLRLILAPHLARTFHHLFPVRPFEELEEATVVGAGAPGETGEAGDAERGAAAPGGQGLEALPILSSSVFTPASAISASNIASFAVTSAGPGADIASGRDGGAPPPSKVINIGPSIIADAADCDRCCFGCLKVIGCRPVTTSNGATGGGEGEAILRFQCPECRNVFCPDCDAFLHETLHNCPGCLAT